MKKWISFILFPILGILFYVLYHCGIQIPCFFHELTGYYCPGCGMGRALYALLNWQWHRAFQLNLLGLILLPWLLCYLQYQLLCWGFDWKDKITKHLPKQVLYGILAIVILYGMMRNIDVFSWMAPIDI